MTSARRTRSDAPPGRLGLFVLRTPRPAAVTDFYHRLAGWTLEPGEARRIGGGQVAMVREGTGGWLPYLTVADLPAAMARTELAGGEVFGPVRSDTSGRSVVVADPTDTLLGVRQVAATEYSGQPEGEPVVWIEQKTRNQDAATSFLQAVFGFSVIGARGPGKVRMLRDRDSAPFGGVMQFDDRWAPDHPPHWLLYLRTADVDAALEVATRQGGSVWFPPVQTPLGRLAYVRDPAGNAVAVVEAAAPPQPVPLPVGAGAATGLDMPGPTASQNDDARSAR